ncbi:chemotaxis protein MotB [Enhydrobacter aerosaccus]|uniref:Chemotaxis protein MotB n=1 Tax=Enhydrobacter aerosaccus TaxID=225324 RepID=A0A1T4K3Z5_9HYPH|nr:peptidoglycan -binding protein [Enhydrobacter aerosaccus]SJZ37154.1 chemotaxis protein MotB [Enhydrobacter aerosaccus]
MAAISRRRSGAADYTWPGYVDALTTLLMVMIFLISVFSVAQFTLSNAVSNRDSAIDALNRQVGTLADQLSFQKRSAEALQRDVDNLTLQLGQLRAERDRLTNDVAAQRQANAALQQSAKAAEDKNLDLQKESERQKLEMTRLAAALAAANDEKGKLFSDLSDEQKLSAEQKANIVRLAAELASVKDELARLNAALDAADAKAKDQQAQIVDLGQKLNRALASKVEELARYRSEFFGKLREALAGQRDVQIVGDRFVFQSEVLFPSGSAQLQPGGEKQLASVAQRLLEISAKIPKDIPWVLQVDGHTDKKPINTTAFPSNWELSAARAIAVVKFLNKQGIPFDHLVAAGYGEFQPLSATDTARNRRIELKLTNR